MTRNNNTPRWRQITAAAIGAGAGAAAISILALAPAAQASPMTFAQACGITHGWVATVVTAGIEECHWQDPNTGNEWIEKSPIGAAPVSASGTNFGQACVVTHGWVATVVTAGIEECYWQEKSTGNEHVISNPLPTKKPPVVKVQPPARSVN
jgi:hypothetical protein